MAQLLCNRIVFRNRMVSWKTLLKSCLNNPVLFNESGASRCCYSSRGIPGRYFCSDAAADNAPSPVILPEDGQKETVSSPSLPSPFSIVSAIGTVDQLSQVTGHIAQAEQEQGESTKEEINEQKRSDWMPVKSLVRDMKLPTRTEIVQNCRDRGIDYVISKHNGYIRITCPECLSSDTLMISSRTMGVNCITCHYSDRTSFKNFNDMHSFLKRPMMKTSGIGKKMMDELDDRYLSSNQNDMDSDLGDAVIHRNRKEHIETRQKKREYDRTTRLRMERNPELEEMTNRSAPIDHEMKEKWNESVDMHEMPELGEQNAFLELRHLLGLESITLDVLSRFHVRAHMDGYDQVAIVYPRYRGPTNRTRPPAGMKVIRKVGHKLEKENYPIDDHNRFTGMFGYHMATPSDSRVILVTNERDALAVYQGTGSGILTLALPKGEILDENILPYLEDFDSIYLWFPPQQATQAKEWAAHLNSSRCAIISHKARPVELLRDGRKKEINRAIREEAIPVRYKGFRSMDDMRPSVRSEFTEHKGRHAGIAQWQRFAILNKYLGGFRLGELTVLTGGTGFGKTTFICEYAMDLQTQGVRTMYCSFEMADEKILKWMIVQFCGPPNVRSLARSRTFTNGVKTDIANVRTPAVVDAWLDRYERTDGDFVIMNTTDEDLFKGGVNGIVEAIRDQVVANGTQHVVIDNLQFLINRSMIHKEVTGFELWSLQDRFVGLMRMLATECNVHITLVVHPRKTEANADLEIQHIGGSARVTQEADNVLVIQRRRDPIDRRRIHKYLNILKNRHGGRRAENDTIEMIYQPSTYTHQLVEVDDAPIK